MANLLTAIRLLLVIPVTLAFALPDLLSPLLLILMLVVAVITDYCDGPLARRLGTASPGGMTSPSSGTARKPTAKYFRPGVSGLVRSACMGLYYWRIEHA